MKLGVFQFERIALSVGLGWGMLLVTMPSGAQSSAVLLQPAASIAKQPTFKYQVVEPGGGKKTVKGLVDIELHTVSSDRDQPLRELLDGQGFVLNQKSLSAVRRLNPEVQVDGTVPAGSKVSYLAPQIPDELNRQGVKTSFDMGAAAKYKIGFETAKASSARQQTYKMSSAVYERKADISVHRRLVADIEVTAAEVEARADKLSGRELALSKYYLSQANDQAQRLTRLSDNSSIRSTDVLRLQRAVEPLDGMRALMKRTGSPVSYRSVKVVVSGVPGGPPVERLRVYTLPGGIIDRPESYPLPELKSLLVVLSFGDLTSPSQDMVAQGEMRVWVGPDHSFDDMAKWVKQGRSIRYVAVQPSTALDNGREIEFKFPNDVVRP